MSSTKYRIEQGNKVLGHFSGHTLQEAVQKAINNQKKYGNLFDEAEPFLLTRGSKTYNVFADGKECN